MLIAQAQSPSRFAGHSARRAGAARLASGLALNKPNWHAPRQANGGQVTTHYASLRSLHPTPSCLPLHKGGHGSVHDKDQTEVEKALHLQNQEVSGEGSGEGSTGAGQGETGIPARARSAFAAIDAIFIENRKGKLPLMLNINVYGFSRGAAAARHFVHLFNSKQSHLPQWPRTNQWRINFVGLFDTVSSFEPKARWIVGGRNFNNDVEELHLNFGEDYAQKVFHLIAGDEYRENFAVTTIASAGAIGQELVIPGAHSDVGGSYVDGAKEVRLLSQERVRQFVYDQGWYPAQEWPMIDPNMYPPNYWHERKVSNDYYKVGYSLMVDVANEHLGPNYFAKPKSASLAQVEEVQTKLLAFIKDKKNLENGKNIRWDLNKEMGTDKARAIRHKLFHVSFSDQIGMAIRIKANKPQRLVIPG
jgi:hypothetical protein